MIPPLAELKGVSKTFGRGRMAVRALDNVDLQIHAGELTLIEGPSGSGKTTLLHILGLLQRADTGEIRIGGQRMDDLPEALLPQQRRDHVALIFQVYNLLESLTAADNVALAGLLSAGSRCATAVGDLLQQVNLEQRADHLPAELSGGERQRTAIARALGCPGRLVLADEPTANLDWENARDVIEGLVDLAHDKGKAVIVVSHDSRLEPFADRIVRLLDGRVSSDQRLREAPVDSRLRTGETPYPRTAGPRRRGRALLLVVIAVALLAGAGGYVVARYAADDPAVKTAPPQDQLPTSVRPYVAAAPAVVEPTTQLVELRAERQGRIRDVLKRAGDPITRGESLIILDDATTLALVSQRRADLKLAEANLAELKAWDRPEKRAQADAAVERAQARLDLAEKEQTRIQALHDANAAQTRELDHAVEEQRQAAAALIEAQQAAAITQAGPTPEEVAVAEARVEQANAALRLAEAEVALRTIVSPLDGHVIYRHLEPGEVVDPESPVPILSVGKLNDVRLRAEVDEADIQRVRVGQRVIATAEAFGEQEITGTVVHLEPMMGRKNIRTQRTTEQQDTKVREVLIELDEGTPSLPIDLQMTVRFLADESPPSPAED